MFKTYYRDSNNSRVREIMFCIIKVGSGIIVGGGKKPKRRDG